MISFEELSKSCGTFFASFSKKLGEKNLGFGKVPKFNPEPNAELLSNGTTLSKVYIKDEDVIIISTDKSGSVKDAERIKDAVEVVFPNNKCLIMMDGLKFGVVAKEQRIDIQNTATNISTFLNNI